MIDRCDFCGRKTALKQWADRWMCARCCQIHDRYNEWYIGIMRAVIAEAKRQRPLNPDDYIFREGNYAADGGSSGSSE